METDPILDELVNQGQSSGLLEDGKAEYGDAYGLGKWPNATLLEVVTYAATDFGYRLGLKLNLKGEDGMPGTFRFDLPRTLHANGEEVPEWKVKKEDDKRATLNRGLAAIGLTSVCKKNIDTPEDYEAIASLFRAKVTQPCPAHVKADGKNQKQDDNGNVVDKDAEGKWVFIPNGFAKLEFLRRKK